MTAGFETPYLDLVRDVLAHAEAKPDRTGTGTFAVFGRMLRFDLAAGFPLLTTKRVHFKSVVHELLWFLKGTDDTAYLDANGVSIWREWQAPVQAADGRDYQSIGPLYGVNWLRFRGLFGTEVNQLDQVLAELRRSPTSRRLVISAWDPATLPDPELSPQENVQAGRAALAPCHAFFQFAVQGGRLSCMLTQRSADLFLGVPFNLASYALLTMMVADQVGLAPGELIWSGGDVHIYRNHVDQLTLQLSREPRPLPRLVLKRRPPSIYDYEATDFELVGYDPHPAIRGAVAI